MQTLTSARRLVRLGVAKATGRPLPFSATFIMTHRCNFRCEYCNVPDSAGDEMSADEYRAAIDDLVAAGLSRASFSGGEALMRRDTIDVIRHAKSRGLTTSMNSNAWLAVQHMDELAEVLDMLVISLDGPERVHDLVRRQKGSYERVVRALDAARERGLTTATITVLSHANLGVVDEVLELADRHGFWAYFQPAYSDCFTHEGGLDPALLPAVYTDLSQRLAAAKRDGKPVGASSAFLDRLGNGPEFGDCSTCNAGRYFGTVMPDGTIVPCHLASHGGPWPNGRTLGFAEAFRSMPRPPPGPGCAISPYNETDLVFALDPRAVSAALRRMAGPPGDGAGRLVGTLSDLADTVADRLADRARGGASSSAG